MAEAMDPDGKALVAAYLVGTRGTPRHAFMLGGTVTIAHTAGVFAIGLVPTGERTPRVRRLEDQALPALRDIGVERDDGARDRRDDSRMAAGDGGRLRRRLGPGEAECAAVAQQPIFVVARRRQ